MEVAGQLIATYGLKILPPVHSFDPLFRFHIKDHPLLAAIEIMKVGTMPVSAWPNWPVEVTKTIGAFYLDHLKNK
jgi:hypothetical protein